MTLTNRTENSRFFPNEILLNLFATYRPAELRKRIGAADDVVRVFFVLSNVPSGNDNFLLVGHWTQPEKSASRTAAHRSPTIAGTSGEAGAAHHSGRRGLLA